MLTFSQNLVPANFAVAAFADVLITTSLVYNLQALKKGVPR